MTLTLDFLTKDEFRGNVGKLPVCQLLNDKARPGLFIKLKDAKLAGWTSSEKDGVEEYTHILFEIEPFLVGVFHCVFHDG